MLKIRCFLQHHLNPIHIYCRINKLPVTSARAQKIALFYEKYIYRFTGLVK